MRLILAAVTALLVGTAVASAQPAPRQATVATVDFDQVPFEDIIAYLRNVTGQPFYVDWAALEAAGVLRETEISLQLPRTSPAVILKFALRAVRPIETLDYYVDDGVVHVTTQRIADAKTVVRTYDIRDLLVTIPDFYPDNLGNGGGQGGQGGGGNNGGGGGQSGGRGGDDEDSEAERAQEIIDLIQATIRPDIWQDNGGTATIRFFRGNLIVNAPRSVHRQL